MWAMTCSSIGDTSSNRSADATRLPPIQWSVETSTPATVVVPIAVVLIVVPFCP
jgi:hypothetical protein